MNGKIVSITKTTKERRENMDDYLGLERKPLSRIQELGSGRLQDSLTRDQYVELFFGVKLEFMQKVVLHYLAFRFNFKDKRATYVSSRRAANDLHITPKTYLKARKELKELGWISIQKIGSNGSEETTLLIGNEIKDLQWKDRVSKSKQLDKDDEKRNDPYQK